MRCLANVDRDLPEKNGSGGTDSWYLKIKVKSITQLVKIFNDWQLLNKELNVFITRISNFFVPHLMKKSKKTSVEQSFCFQKKFILTCEEGAIFENKLNSELEKKTFNLYFCL